MCSEVTTPNSPGFPNSTWGSASDVQKLASDMQWMQGYSARHGNLTVVMGEYGCSVQQPDASVRSLWYETITSAAERVGVAPVIWDDNGWFRTYDRANRTWDDAVLRAIGLL